MLTMKFKLDIAFTKLPGFHWADGRVDTLLKVDRKRIACVQHISCSNCAFTTSEGLETVPVS